MADPNTSTTTTPVGGAGTIPPAGQGTNTPASSSDALLSSIQDRLFKSSGMVSSDTSNMDQLIGSAISGLQQGQTAKDTGINADYQSQKIQAQQTGNQNMTAEMEARRGMATNTGIIQNIQETTTKNLNALDLQQKQAIATGDTETAGKIADLKVQQIQFQQDAQQKAFTNQLNLYSAVQAQKSNDLAAQKQSFDEQSTMSSIALQYGIKLQPGDTLANVVGRAAPMASQAQQADLALKMAQTQEAKANAAKALNGLSTALDPATISSMASTLSNLLNSGNQNSVAQAQAMMQNVLSTSGATGLNKIQAEINTQANKAFDPDTMGKNLDMQFSQFNATSASNAAQFYQQQQTDITNNQFVNDQQKRTALGVALDAYQRWQQKNPAVNSQFAGGLLGAFINSRNPNLAKQSP